jgi:hypothetical protein
MGQPAGDPLLARRPGPSSCDARSPGATVVLWFEHDLYDQLQLVDVLALAREEGARRARS